MHGFGTDKRRGGGPKSQKFSRHHLCMAPNVSSFGPNPLPPPQWGRHISMTPYNLLLFSRTLPVWYDAGDGHAVELGAAEAAQRAHPHHGHRAQDVHQGRMDYSVLQHQHSTYIAKSLSKTNKMSSIKLHSISLNLICSLS